VSACENSVYRHFIRDGIARIQVKVGATMAMLLVANMSYGGGCCESFRTSSTNQTSKDTGTSLQSSYCPPVRSICLLLKSVCAPSRAFISPLASVAVGVKEALVVTSEAHAVCLNLRAPVLASIHKSNGHIAFKSSSVLTGSLSSAVSALDMPCNALSNNSRCCDCVRSHASMGTQPSGETLR
jgi:hypothetical protein